MGEKEAADDVTRRDLMASARFFDAAGEAFHAGRVDDEGRIGEPQRFFETMWAGALKLGREDATSAAMAFLECKAKLSSPFVVRMLEACRDAKGDEAQLAEWLKGEINANEEMRGAGFDPESADWPVIGRTTLKTILQIVG